MSEGISVCACVSVLTYNTGTWTLTKTNLDRLDVCIPPAQHTADKINSIQRPHRN